MPYRFQNETSQNVRQKQHMNSRIQKVHIVQTDNLPLLLPRIKHETCYSVAEKKKPIAKQIIISSSKYYRMYMEHCQDFFGAERHLRESFLPQI